MLCGEFISGLERNERLSGALISGLEGSFRGSLTEVYQQETGVPFRGVCGSLSYHVVSDGIP